MPLSLWPSLATTRGPVPAKSSSSTSRFVHRAGRQRQ
jgi:hypothetical protein